MTTTVVSQTNSESVVNTAVVKMTTNADSAAAYFLALGFTPRHVKIMNITDLLEDEWYEGMGANTALHMVGSTGVVTATTGITVSDGGVTFGSGIMIASKTFYVKAEG